ncbi:VOC family protein [Nonomuraea jiangxiensis]|uniref:Catechol 2,3-dioxygenase n=1 Tax=Nonomuraea jiangxiensis TaxID=633440 RepID=A0A1G9IUU4_9ACTN|nr:VOC family protein [Nonomuraea jiangxiensis]SDL28967.1 Catechol 2,3-dioxygenase [Nonomuraea jiangxiensis]
MPPHLRLTSVTVGTSRPRELARFYARLLGWRVTKDEGPEPGEPEEAGWAQIGPPGDVAGLTVSFEYERCYASPVWPSEFGSQNASQHLDIEVDDLPAAVEWALACGATLAGFQPQHDVRVMLDPDGHPFCLFL